MQRYPRPESEGGGVVVRELSNAEYAEQAREYAERRFCMMSAMADMVGIRKVFGQSFAAVN